MSEHPVPAPLRELGPPWSLTRWGARRPESNCEEDLAELLDRVLAGLEQRPPVPDVALPDDLRAGWSFALDWLAEAMPDLRAITREAVAARLAESFGEPSPATVDAVAGAWLRGLLEDLLGDVLGALRACERAGALEPEPLVAVLERRLPLADPPVAARVLSDVVGTLGARAAPLLDQLARDDGLAPDLRRKIAVEGRRIAES
jgi:hypothetical protein